MVGDVRVVFDVAVVFDDVGVVVDEELGGMVDDGKSQPFTWMAITTVVFCAVAWVLVQDPPDMDVAMSKTSPGLRCETHSPGLSTPKLSEKV